MLKSQKSSRGSLLSDRPLFAKVLISQTFAVGGVVAQCHEKQLVRACQSGSEVPEIDVAGAGKPFRNGKVPRPLDTYAPSKN